MCSPDSRCSWLRAHQRASRHQPLHTAAPPATTPVAAAKPTTAPPPPTTARCATNHSGRKRPADKVKLQLKWVPQAQFAGYFVALEKGYYKDENLDVTIVPGGPDIVSEQQVANGQADFGVDWVASFLAFRDKGLPLVDVAQIYQSSGLLLVSKKSANITKPEDLKGKNVGVWYGGNEFEFLALMDKLKFDPDKDMTVIKQGFTMDPFLAGQMDAASAMTYNEYQIVLESGVKAEDLNVINYTTEGVGMLEDNLFASEDMVKAKPDLVQRFVRASIKGWQGAIDDQPFAVTAVMKYAEPGLDDRGPPDAHDERGRQTRAPQGMDQGSDWRHGRRALQDYRGHRVEVPRDQRGGRSREVVHEPDQPGIAASLVTQRVGEAAMRRRTQAPQPRGTAACRLLYMRGDQPGQCRWL